MALALPEKTCVLYKGAHYSATYLASCKCLVVSSNRVDKGVYIKNDHPKFAEWMEAFIEDADIGHALCRALCNN